MSAAYRVQPAHGHGESGQRFEGEVEVPLAGAAGVDGLPVDAGQGGKLAERRYFGEHAQQLGEDPAVGRFALQVKPGAVEDDAGYWGHASGSAAAVQPQ